MLPPSAIEAGAHADDDPRMSRPLRRRIAALAAGALLAGCQVGPAFHRPTPPVPARFDAAGAAAPGAAPNAAPPRNWWEGFGSPELSGLIARARTRTYSLREAVAQLEIANAQVLGAGAPLLPSLTGGAGASFSQAGPDVSGRGFGTKNSVTHSYSASFQAAYQIDFWGKNRDALEAAEANADAARFNIATVRLTAEAAVATTYFQALADADLLDTARRNLAAARGLRDQLRAELAAGVTDAQTLAQQEALVAAEAATIPNLQSLYRQQVIALGTLTGQAPEFLHVQGGSLGALHVPAIAPGLPGQLLDRRPDIAQATANLVAANASVREAIAAFYPNIALTGSAGWQSGALTALVSPGSALLSAAASLTQPIFDGGALLSTLRVDRATWDERVALYEAAVAQAFADVETTLTALRYATRQERLQAEAVDRARAALTAAEAQLAAGTVDIGTVLNAEQSLLNDQNTLVGARLTRLDAAVNLYKALGGGWQWPRDRGH
ncbi:MAG: efflux transporter outer membrane subunit [Rhodospirillales bacterium]|nr:efflux transporter outer membrane subunit [Rhodospirillales bacterium]